MCMTRKDTKKDKDAWLKSQPKMITAYKVVEVREDEGIERLFPLFNYVYKPFTRKNRLKEIPPKKEARFSHKKLHTRYQTEKAGMTSYIAYYHFFAEEADTINWAFSVSFERRKVIKCLIPKHFVTDVGNQNHLMVIVARGFNIVGEDEYLLD